MAMMVPVNYYSAHAYIAKVAMTFANPTKALGYVHLQFAQF